MTDSLSSSWLHMTVDRHQAEQILMERGVDGSFLVRPQQRGSGEYAISLKYVQPNYINMFVNTDFGNVYMCRSHT